VEKRLANESAAKALLAALEPPLPNLTAPLPPLANAAILNDLSQAMALGALEVGGGLTDAGYMGAVFSNLAREHLDEQGF